MPRKSAKRAIVPPPPKRAARPKRERRRRRHQAPHSGALYRAHEPTAAAPSGLGAQLGGTARLELLCPRPPPTASLPPLPPLIDAPSALTIELARVRALAGLRARLAELCRARGVEVAPMNAFERWRFLGTWSEAGSATADPLLPSAAACASVSYAAGADARRCSTARGRRRVLAEDLAGRVWRRPTRRRQRRRSARRRMPRASRLAARRATGARAAAELIVETWTTRRCAG